MKSIPVLLMGCGGVGRQLLDHIVACRSLHSKQGLALRVLGICDSHTLLAVNDAFNVELKDDFLKEICRCKSSGFFLSSLTDFGQCEIFEESDARKRVIEIASILGRSTGLVLVDCSSSSETVEVLKQGIDLGCCVVLANKKPLTSKIEDFDKLLSNFRRIRFESTVGAGLPVIASVTRVLSSGDSIYRINGSLSGTLGYVMSELEDGKLLSNVVQEAKRLGYTEPGLTFTSLLTLFYQYAGQSYPPNELFTMALILARLLGRRISLEDIKVDSLYPDDMGPKSMPIDGFLNSGLPMFDGDVREKVEMAASKGNVLRYVCTIEGSRCQVGLQELPKASSLGRLRGSDNVVYCVCFYDFWLL